MSAEKVVRLRPVAADADPAVERVRAVIERARRAGYRMVESAVSRDRWELCDAEDGELLFSGGVGQVEKWLDS